MIRLINGLDAAPLQDTLRFQALTPQRFLVKKSTWLHGTYLYAGDLLRLESISTQQLEAMAHLLKKVNAGPERVVAFYHLEVAVMQAYGSALVKKIVERFSDKSVILK